MPFDPSAPFPTTLFDHLRDFLVADGIARRPDQAGAGDRPWLPPVWRAPDEGAIGPGDKAEQGAPDTQRDDGLVLSLMPAPGLALPAGDEDMRADGVDLVMRGQAVAPIAALDAATREALIERGGHPGGRIDFDLAGLYIVQCRPWSPFQLVSAANGVYTFRAGYLFERLA